MLDITKVDQCLYVVTNLFLTQPQLLGQLVIRETSHLGRIDAPTNGHVRGAMHAPR